MVDEDSLTRRRLFGTIDGAEQNVPSHQAPQMANKYAALVKNGDAGSAAAFVNLSIDDADGDGVSAVSLTSWRPPSAAGACAVYSAESLDDSVEYSANDSLPPPSSSPSRRGAPTSSVDSIGSFPIKPKCQAPKQPFDFHICKLPLRHVIDRHVDLKDLEGLEFVAEGSHSEVYAATWRGKAVIVKVLSSRNADNERAIHEFNVECELLCRMSQPHILGVLGAGTVPRPFILVERIRVLSHILDLQSPDPPLSGMAMFRPSAFKFAQVLQHAKDLADALSYCHRDLHTDAMVVHRDLTPENVGIGADGCLYLFDWGLCRCVFKRTDVHQENTMTGMAGSLRYMAPEMVLRQPYTEKVDVYSFGLVVWAMARNDAPYKGLGRRAHYDRVVLNHERPAMPAHWPQGFRDLLASCWHADPRRRPAFPDVSNRLAELLSSTHPKQPPASPRAAADGRRRFSSISTASGASSWSAGTSKGSDAASNKLSGRISQALRRSFSSLFSFARPAAATAATAAVSAAAAAQGEAPPPQALTMSAV